MKRNYKRFFLFNSKVLWVSFIPLSIYLASIIYTYFQVDTFYWSENVMSMFLDGFLLLVAGLCFAIQHMGILLVGLAISLLFGIRACAMGLMNQGIDWGSLIESAFMIAYGIAMFEFGRQRLHRLKNK